MAALDATTAVQPDSAASTAASSTNARTAAAAPPPQLPLRETYPSDRLVESVGVVLVRLGSGSARQLWVQQPRGSPPPNPNPPNSTAAAPPSPRVTGAAINPAGLRLLPQGYCNVGESREAAALRVVRERCSLPGGEQGICCTLLPLDLRSLKPPVGGLGRGGGANMGSKVAGPPAAAGAPRAYRGVCEPFLVDLLRRPAGGGGGGHGLLGIVWWFVAIVDEDSLPPAERYAKTTMPAFCDFDKALDKATSEADRKVVAAALTLVNQKYPQE